MRKKKKKENVTGNVLCPNGIGPTEMKNIIAEAIIQADEMRIQKEEEARKEKGKQWDETIGYKDYSNKKWPVRWFFRFINDVFILLKLPTISEEKIETDWMSWSLLKTVLEIMFRCITFAFYISFIIFICMAIQQKNILYISVAFLLYALAGIFRITTVEIKKIKDRNYLISLFTAIVTVISVIIAVWRK